MAYDEKLAERVRGILAGNPSLTERYVAPEGHAMDRDLQDWIGMAEGFVGTLPAK